MDTQTLQDKKEHHHTICLPTQLRLTGSRQPKTPVLTTRIELIKTNESIEALSSVKESEGKATAASKRISPGRSIRLGCWRQNAGVSGTGPGSSHVHPVEIMGKVGGWVGC